MEMIKDIPAIGKTSGVRETGEGCDHVKTLSRESAPSKAITSTTRSILVRGEAFGRNEEF